MKSMSAPLAAMYSTSVMEHHHFNQTVTILQQVYFIIWQTYLWKTLNIEAVKSSFEQFVLTPKYVSFKDTFYE